MNRTTKEATVKRCHYDSHAQLTAHLYDFISACNHARRLKTLRGLIRTTNRWDQTPSSPERRLLGRPCRKDRGGNGFI